MGASDITFTIQAEDDDENLSDSDSVPQLAISLRVFGYRLLILRR